VPTVSPVVVTFPGNKRPRESEPLQPIAAPLEVLLYPVLYDLGAVADVA
jgi:hypothetical protein